LSVVCSHHRLFMRLGAARQQPIQNIQNQIDNNSQQAIRQSRAANTNTQHPTSSQQPTPWYFILRYRSARESVQGSGQTPNKPTADCGVKLRLV
jgi:type 1 fimbria pilin